MMARSHVVVGLASWIAAAPALHLPVIDPLGLVIVVLGSLLPDIDHPKSWVGRRTRPVSTAIASALGHRGVTHSAIAVAGLTFLLLHAGYGRDAVAALTIGYLSHLAADMLTPRGLRLAWPFPGTWSLPLCRTGSATENLIVLLLIGGIGLWLLRHPFPLTALWPRQLVSLTAGNYCPDNAPNLIRFCAPPGRAHKVIHVVEARQPGWEALARPPRRAEHWEIEARIARLTPKKAKTSQG